MLRLPLKTWLGWVALMALALTLNVALIATAQEGPALRLQQPKSQLQPKAQPAPQPGPEPKAPPSRPAPPAVPPGLEEQPRDPTTVRPDLRPVLDPPAAQQGAAAVPVVALRGRIVLASGESSGILDVNGQMFLVKEGSQIDTFIGQGTPVTVKVKTFSAAGVAVEIEQLGKTFQLR